MENARWGKTPQVLLGVLGPVGDQFVILAVDTLKRFRVLMHAMLKVDLHQELKRLVQGGEGGA